MTDEQFNTLLATFGADLSRWPHDSRVAAMALLRDSTGAQRAYEAARALDTDLRREDERLAPDRRAALVDSIMGALDETVAALLLTHVHYKTGRMRDMKIDCRQYAYEHGVDLPEVRDWRWPD